MVVLTVCSPALGFFAARSRSLLFALPWRPDTPWALLWGSSSVNSCSMKSVNSWHSSSSLWSHGWGSSAMATHRGSVWDLETFEIFTAVIPGLVFLTPFWEVSSLSLSFWMDSPYLPHSHFQSTSAPVLYFQEKKKSNSWYLWWIISSKGFPDISVGKESICNTGDLGLILGLGRFPREGKGYPLQYSGLENSMDCIVHGVAKSWIRLSNLYCPIFSQNGHMIWPRIILVLHVLPHIKK